MEFIMATVDGNREMTAEEIAEYNTTIQEAAESEAIIIAQAETVKSAKEAVLAKLGLTAEEVAALLA